MNALADMSALRKPAVWLLAVALVICAFPLTGSATLGGDVSSVQNDQEHMRASLRVTNGTSYTVHEVRAATGHVVKEYVSPAGRVFAVSWQGPTIPDMQQIIGTYFEQYIRAAQARHGGHGPLLIELPELVVQQGGHMRAFSGKAYVPQLLPQGVSAEAIR